MMHPRWLALPLAALTAAATVPGCATAPAPRMLSADLHIGALDDRTSFELDDSGRGSKAANEREDDDLDDLDEGTDTPKKQRIRRLLYLTGLGAVGFGIVGTVGFGLGGRIVQAQMKNGYEDGDLTREREDQLSTTGTVMNALAITSAVIGLAGVITAATVYGIDHARCGELRPRRKQCADGKGEGGAASGANPAPGAEPEAAPAPPSDAAPGQDAAGTPESPSDPAAGDVQAPDGSTTAPPVGPAPAAPGPSPAGGKPSPAGGKTGPAAKPSPSAPSGGAPG